jgi:hypothetical protein
MKPFSWAMACDIMGYTPKHVPPTLAEVEEMRRGQPISKGPSRLEARVERDAMRIVDDRQFRADVWARDGYVCRCCGRKVKQTLANIPERREIHHIHGRLGELRHEVRAAVGVCNFCHQRLTGQINDRLQIVATRTFALDGHRYTDATYPLRFERVA